MLVDLPNLITTFSLDKKTLAKVLFPVNRHPDLALSRLLAERSTLNEKQLFALSTFTGLTIDQLYKSSMYWKSVTQNHLIRFTKGKYTALYDSETGITKILLLDKQISLHVIAPKAQTLTEFLQSINSIIVKQTIQKS